MVSAILDQALISGFSPVIAITEKELDVHNDISNNKAGWERGHLASY
jgi:hypothetical protein